MLDGLEGLVEFGGEFWNRHILFRDYLRLHTDIKQQYAELKLDLAKREIRQNHQVVIVEGYMDVLQAWQSGYRNVVAQNLCLCEYVSVFRSNSFVYYGYVIVDTIV